MLTFTSEEMKFFRQFKNTDLVTILRVKRDKAYKCTAYEPDVGIHKMFQGTAQALDSILDAIESKSE